MNAGIPRREYLGVSHSYCLPCVADLGKPGGLPLEHRHVAGLQAALGGPLALPLFGIIVDSRRYADIVLLFGCQTPGTACVRVTGAVTWLMRHQGIHAIVYGNDFFG